MQKKSLETILYSAVGVVIMLVILVGLNVITAPVHKRVDLTKEKVYTLSDGTKAILSKLDTAVKIRYYCTQPENVTPDTVFLKGYAKEVEDLLAEYQQAAHGKLILEKYHPQPESDAEDSAGLDGIEPQQLRGGEKFYLGLAVSQLDAKEAIPFLSPARERELEYDITRAISRVVRPTKPIIGVMSALPVFGAEPNPMMQQMGQQQGQQPPWQLITELQNDYTLRRVLMDANKIDDDIRVLLVIYPKDISDATQYALDQFVMRGGKLIAFLDATSLVDSRGQNPMMGQVPGGGASLEKLLNAWGLKFDTSKVVADSTFALDMGDGSDPTQKRPVWLQMTPEGINSNDISTAELDSIWYFSGGAFTGTPAQGLTETVLLNSTANSQMVDGMLANFSNDSVLKDFKPSGVQYALAVRLHGKFKTAFPNGMPGEKSEETNRTAKADTTLKESKEDNTVVLVGDSDMFYDGFTIRRVNTLFGPALQAINGNLSFAENLVEVLSGDNNLIEVRSRAVLAHPFTRFKKILADAQERSAPKIKESQDNYNKAAARIQELQQQKSPNQQFIESPEQKAEMEKAEKAKAKFNADLKAANKELTRDVDALKRKVEVVNIAAMPLLVIVAGVGLAVFKRKRNSAK